MRLYFVLIMHHLPGPHGMRPEVAGYYDGLAVFADKRHALRTAKRLTRKLGGCYFIRVLPWHSEMGEVDPDDMWRSALTVEQVKS